MGEEGTLGEQIESRWKRFLSMLKKETKSETERAQLESLVDIGPTAVIVLFRRHVNPHRGLIRSKSLEALLTQLPEEHAWLGALLRGITNPELTERLWLYIELFAELTAEVDTEEEA